MPKATQFFNEQILDRCLFYSAFVAVPTIIASLARLPQMGWSPLFIYQIIAFLFHMIFVLMRKKINLKIKTHYFIVTFFLLGFMSIIQLGINGLGVAMFTIVVAMISFAYNVKTAFFTGLIIGLLMLLLGVLTIHGVITLSPLPDLYSYSTWITAFFSFAFLQVIVLLIPASYLKLLHDKNQNLTRLSNELEDAMKIGHDLALERKQLLHVLCHDLSNPLGAIHSIMELYQDDPEILDEDMVKHLNIAIHSGTEVINTVRSLLAVEDTKISLNRQHLPISDLINNSYLLLDYKFKEKNIELVSEIPKELTIYVDRSIFLNSILNNLMTNALKFSEPNSKITISTKQIDTEVQINVKDCGVGMPQELVYDLFKLNKVTTRSGTNGEKGTGFGMPIVKKFVELFGGRIEVISRDINAHPDDHGTTITLIFPSL